MEKVKLVKKFHKCAYVQRTPRDFFPVFLINCTHGLVLYSYVLFGQNMAYYKILLQNYVFYFLFCISLLFIHILSREWILEFDSGSDISKSVSIISVFDSVCINPFVPNTPFL